MQAIKTINKRQLFTRVGDPEIKTCKHCGISFVKQTYNQCFCSPDCRRVFHGELQTKRQKEINKSKRRL